MIDPVVMLWIVLIAIGLVGSALYSGLETGSYTLSRVRLRLLEAEGDRRAIRLRRMIENPARLLAVLLIANNVTNYLGTAGVAVLLERGGLGAWQTVVVNALIMAPLLMIFGETLPKDLFSTYSDRLMRPFSGLLEATSRLLSWVGVVPLVMALSAGFARMVGVPPERSGMTPRRHMLLLMQEGLGAGVLRDEQTRLLRRAMNLGAQKVGQHAVTWDRVAKLRITDKVADAQRLCRETGHSRFPLLDEQGQVLGVVNVFETLLAASQPSPPLVFFSRECERFDARLPLRNALRRLQRSPVHMAIVTNDDRPVGVVTMKDLLETLAGEIHEW
ncbi:MAG: DUF21 domain-containing protein [Phycisphaeraceae bacterium]|nr:DUF21 domain-containing protein [Phycisphaeraceae bacterium]